MDYSVPGSKEQILLEPIMHQHTPFAQHLYAAPSQHPLAHPGAADQPAPDSFHADGSHGFLDQTANGGSLYYPPPFDPSFMQPRQPTDVDRLSLYSSSSSDGSGLSQLSSLSPAASIEDHPLWPHSHLPIQQHQEYLAQQQGHPFDPQQSAHSQSPYVSAPLPPNADNGAGQWPFYQTPIHSEDGSVTNYSLSAEHHPQYHASEHQHPRPHSTASASSDGHSSHSSYQESHSYYMASQGVDPSSQSNAAGYASNQAFQYADQHQHPHHSLQMQSSHPHAPHASYLQSHQGYPSPSLEQQQHQQHQQLQQHPSRQTPDISGLSLDAAAQQQQAALFPYSPLSPLSPQTAGAMPASNHQFSPQQQQHHHGAAAAGPSGRDRSSRGGSTNSSPYSANSPGRYFHQSHPSVSTNTTTSITTPSSSSGSGGGGSGGVGAGAALYGGNAVASSSNQTSPSKSASSSGQPSQGKKANKVMGPGTPTYPDIPRPQQVPNPVPEVGVTKKSRGRTVPSIIPQPASSSSPSSSQQHSHQQQSHQQQKKQAATVLYPASGSMGPSVDAPSVFGAPAGDYASSMYPSTMGKGRELPTGPFGWDSIPSQSVSSTTNAMDPASVGPLVPGSPEADLRSRPFVCQVEGCGKAYIRAEHLKRHVRSIHTHDKPYDCPFPGCNKEFNRYDNLCQHFKGVHGSNEQPKKQRRGATE